MTRKIFRVFSQPPVTGPDAGGRPARMLLLTATCGVLFAAAGAGYLGFNHPVYAHEKHASATTQDVDPNALTALATMSTYLQTLQSFQVHAITSTEDVLNDGEKIQYHQLVDLKAVKPNRLSVNVSGDEIHRLYLYNGTSFTLYGKLLHYYATIPAPPTIKDTSDLLEAKYGVDLPLVDLFRWGTPSATNGQITGAYDVGKETIAGVPCEHYAFRQTGLDWQIWIKMGDQPLPLRLVMTTTTDAARPQHEALLDWDLSPTFDAGTFAFDPPADAHKIVMSEVINKK